MIKQITQSSIISCKTKQVKKNKYNIYNWNWDYIQEHLQLSYYRDKKNTHYLVDLFTKYKIDIEYYDGFDDGIDDFELIKNKT